MILRAMNLLVEETCFHHFLATDYRSGSQHLSLFHQQAFESYGSRRGAELHKRLARGRGVALESCVTIHHVQGWVGVQEFHLLREILGQPDVVAIQEGEPLAPGVTDAQVASPAGAAIFLSQINDSGKIWLDNLFEPFRIRRSVV